MEARNISGSHVEDRCLQNLDQNVSSEVNITVSYRDSGDCEENKTLFGILLDGPTPSEEASKPSGSPIMRGIQNMFNMFRSSQSPIVVEQNREEVCTPQSKVPSKSGPELVNGSVIASTPVSNSQKDVSSSKRTSPLKESIIFNDELSNELQWNNDSTILFGKERIPIHKLFLPQVPGTSESSSYSDLTTKDITQQSGLNKNLNMSIEPMDISYNEQNNTQNGEIMINNNIITDTLKTNIKPENTDCALEPMDVSYDESIVNKMHKQHVNEVSFSETRLLNETNNNSVFLDCETSLYDIQNETDLLRSFNDSVNTYSLPESQENMTEMLKESVEIDKQNVENLPLKPQNKGSQSSISNENNGKVNDGNTFHNVGNNTIDWRNLDISNLDNSVELFLDATTNLETIECEKTYVNETLNNSELDMTKKNATVSAENHVSTIYVEEINDNISSKMKFDNITNNNINSNGNKSNYLNGFLKETVQDFSPTMECNNGTFEIPNKILDLDIDQSNTIVVTEPIDSTTFVGIHEIVSEELNNIVKTTGDNIEIIENQAKLLNNTIKQNIENDVLLEATECINGTKNPSTIIELGITQNNTTADTITIVSTNFVKEVYETNTEDVNKIDKKTDDNLEIIENLNKLLNISLKTNTQDTNILSETSECINKTIENTVMMLKMDTIQSNSTIDVENERNIFDNKINKTVSKEINNIVKTTDDNTEIFEDQNKSLFHDFKNSSLKDDVLLKTIKYDDQVISESNTVNSKNCVSVVKVCDNKNGEGIKDIKKQNELFNNSLKESIQDDLMLKTIKNTCNIIGLATVEKDISDIPNNIMFENLVNNLSEMDSKEITFPVKHMVLKENKNENIDGLNENVIIKGSESSMTCNKRMINDSISTHLDTVQGDITFNCTKNIDSINSMKELYDTVSEEINYIAREAEQHVNDGKLNELNSKSEVTNVVKEVLLPDCKNCGYQVDHEISGVNKSMQAINDSFTEVQTSKSLQNENVNLIPVDVFNTKEKDVECNISDNIITEVKTPSDNVGNEIGMCMNNSMNSVNSEIRLVKESLTEFKSDELKATSNNDEKNFKVETILIKDQCNNKYNCENFEPNLNDNNTQITTKEHEIATLNSFESLSNDIDISKCNETNKVLTCDNLKTLNKEINEKVAIDKNENLTIDNNSERGDMYSPESTLVKEGECSSEVHTEDEDTIEGPFLDDDFIDLVTEESEIKTEIDVNEINYENMEPEEIFIDAAAYDFLMNQNGNTISEKGKESLFLKFDPLCAKKETSDGILTSLLANTVTKTIKNISSENMNIVNEIHYDGPSEESFEDLNVTVAQKPTMAVIPAVNNDATNRLPVTPTRPVTRRSFGSPAITLIDRLLTISANNTPVHRNRMTEDNFEQEEANKALIELKLLLSNREQDIEILKSESYELKSRLMCLENEMNKLETINKDKLAMINNLNEKFENATNKNKNMVKVVEEFERTIASLMSELEQEKKQHEEERTRLINERDEQTAHLASMEVSFSDLHSKYEKSKQVILGFKANEDSYKASLSTFEENLQKMQNTYELLKQHATSKLNRANEELEKIKRTHESEVLKMNTMIKRKELHITSLEETLNQKVKANEELTAICDELINKVG